MGLVVLNRPRRHEAEEEESHGNAGEGTDIAQVQDGQGEWGRAEQS